MPLLGQSRVLAILRFLQTSTAGGPRPRRRLDGSQRRLAPTQIVSGALNGEVDAVGAAFRPDDALGASEPDEAAQLAAGHSATGEEEQGAEGKAQMFGGELAVERTWSTLGVERGKVAEVGEGVATFEREAGGQSAWE